MLFRIRSLLARFPGLSWLPAVVIAVVVAMVVSSLVDRATAEARRLGPPVRVPVATRAVDVGEVLGADTVAWRRLPRSAVPVGDVVTSAEGRTALVPLAEGEVLLASKLGPDGLRGVAALLPAGMQALAVPAATGTPPLEVGDRVDVLGAFDSEAVVVSADAVVVGVDAEAVTVAVAAADAPRLAWALARAAVTLALSSPLE